ncbi:MAG: sulfate ABC transporter substrate-binding protein [Betaproteobacteria bacterium HGW-Betaproteobacteria-6]|jgi:sulfate transport system substrate-binding protein|nr:MAG: sulfate ABC transporter substrate-binding protein [Betaproteobacteria bacterium HGW-Betaproteobacteria-6]
MSNFDTCGGLLRRSMAALAFLTAGSAFAQTAILNVSYDVSRELYKEINPAFVASWKRQVGTDITVIQSHGGSSKQAGAVIGGLGADVITMNQSPDIDILVERGGLVAADWRKQFPHEATPYTTTSVFLVRKGNPKAINDWNDLTRAGLQVIVPNPKTSGNGRYTYLAAWGYALDKTGSEAGARDFVSKLFANVPVLDGGGRGATTTFTQRDVGDVLVTFENEAILIARELGSNKFDIVYPSLSIDAAAPVAVIQKVAAKHGTEKVAKAYLDFLYTPAGQEIIAKHNFRPRDPEVLKKHAAKYPAIRTFSVEQKLGGWAAVKKAHFADGAIYDQITAKK